MKQEYFVVVLAHSLRGRLRRIHIPHQAVYVILALALLGSISMFGFVASYARMAWKVANYNALRREADALRVRYQNLQKVVSQTDQQLASLELYANEVSIAYGIKQKLEGPSDIAAQGKLIPSFAESVRDYDFLRSANALTLLSSPSRRFHTAASIPNLWPVDGRLTGSFGMRLDPFLHLPAMHTGLDFRGEIGDPVRATASGTVTHAGWSGGYGRMVEIDHGNGFATRYGHLSGIDVEVGQPVRLGQTVGRVGSTGRSTGPHLHYETRVEGEAVDPLRFLRAGARLAGTS